MNAYQIMGFLLLLNLSISGMSMIADATGGNFYDIDDLPVDEQHDLERIKEDSSGAYAFITSTFFSSIITSAIGGAILGTIVTYATKIPADSAYVYSLFSSFYWVTTSGTILILWGFTNRGSVYVDTGIFIVIAIFTIVVCISYVSFFVQLVKGGWSSYT